MKCSAKLIVPKSTSRHHMVDQQSTWIVVFKLATKTFAYCRLAQELRASLMVFFSFFCKYLSPVFKADHSAKDTEGIGWYFNDFFKYSNINETSSIAYRKTLALGLAISEFGTQGVDFFGKKSPRKVELLKARKSLNFLKTIEISRSEKALQR